MKRAGAHLVRRTTMRAVSLGLVAVTLALGVWLSPVMGAEDHVMVTPNDLTWADVPSLPPGAKVAVIEGPMDQATPFTIRLKFPADYKIRWCPSIAWMKGRRSEVDCLQGEPGVQGELPWSTQSPSSLLPCQARPGCHCLGDPAL